MAPTCLALHLPFTATLPDFMHVIEYSHILSSLSEVTMLASPREEPTHHICASIHGKSAGRYDLQFSFMSITVQMEFPCKSCWAWLDWSKRNQLLQQSENNKAWKRTLSSSQLFKRSIERPVNWQPNISEAFSCTFWRDFIVPHLDAGELRRC